MTAPYVSDKNALVIAVLLALSVPVGSQPFATKTADQLSRELSDGSAKVRGRAAADLSRLGYEAIQAVPALSAALKHDDAAVRSGAALTISKIGPEAAAAQGGSQDANLAQEPAPPSRQGRQPNGEFWRMVSGEWRTTALAGTSTFDTWHWGPGQHSMRVMTDGSGAAGEPWRELQVFYWHPGRKQVCLLGLSPFARGVSDGTIKFEGETADGVFDLYQTGATPRLRKMGLHWAFDGPDKYHDILLEATGPDGLKPMNEWDHIRSKAPTAKRQRTGEEAPKPSGRLKALESLLGHTWNAKGNWGNGDAFHIESTFEWIPLANAIYARSFALRGNGEPTHVLDAYFYHHTGTDRLHCLALSNLGGVYEGDLTVLDGGALQLDLKGYEGERVVPYVVRFDFEKDGTLHHRIWSLAGAERTPMLDVHHTVSEMSKSIWYVFQDKKDNYWFGSDGQGVYRFDGTTITHFTTKDGLSNDRIRGIQQHKSGDILITTLDGVSKYNGQRFVTLPVTVMDSPDKGWVLDPDDVWLPWQPGQKGPYHYDGKTLYHLKFPKHPRRMSTMRIIQILDGVPMKCTASTKTAGGTCGSAHRTSASAASMASTWIGCMKTI